MTDDLSPASAREDPAAFARTVGELVTRPDPPVAELEARLDAWAAGTDDVLALAAVAAYAEVARVRPDWLADEVRKLTAATSHPSPAVRAAAATALTHFGRDLPLTPSADRDESAKHSDEGGAVREPPMQGGC